MKAQHLRIITALLATSICAASVAAAPLASGKAEESVLVEFFEEALCPFCAQFSTNILGPLLRSNLTPYIDFNLVPYGNAKETSKGLQCQHGPLECRLNRLFACAIDQSKTQEDYWPFVECVESNYGDKIETSLKGCAKDNGFSLKDLEDCASGSRGDALERAAGEQTNSLQPAHQYVPWVVVNGVPLEDDYANLQKYVCVAIREIPKPALCRELSDSQAPLGVDLNEALPSSS